MILRLLLVGVVSGLGIQPPPADSLRSWADEGREWWVARVAEWNEAFVPVREEVAEEDVPSVDDFLADSPSDLCVVTDADTPAKVADKVEVVEPAESVAIAEPVEPDAVAEAVEPVQPDIDALFDEAQEEMVAEFLADPMVGQAGEGVLVASNPEPTDDQAGVEGDSCETDLFAEAAEPAPAPVAEPGSNLRLARALKLTGDALHAWAALLQGDRAKTTYQ